MSGFFFLDPCFVADLTRIMLVHGTLLGNACNSTQHCPNSLRTVELDSTSCNACCNKNVAGLFHFGNGEGGGEVARSGLQYNLTSCRKK